ncbi:MAG: 2-oxoacid:acceptor oxidoreductase family protein, partial [Planctomycetota bacterium]
MRERAIMAGFGGQGLMFLGKLTVKTMMDEGMQVTYFPSYGAEVRGGTANCHVIVSSDEIASPMVEEADTLVV